jgi:hypothetical protein
MSAASSTKRNQSLDFDEEMATARFARRLKRHLRLINVLLIINIIAWSAATIWLIRYLCR